MALESFDPGVVTAEEFPLLTRLHHFISSGWDVEDVLAGMTYVQPRLDAVFSNELQLLIDGKKQYDLAIELCDLVGPLVVPAGRIMFIANAGHCEEKRGNLEEGRKLCMAALDIAESTDEDWGAGYAAWCCNQLAWGDFKSGNFADGAEWADKAIAANPEFWNAYGTLGSCLYELGDDRAYEAFETAMQNGVDPEEPTRLKDDERYQALAEKYDIPLPTGD